MSSQDGSFRGYFLSIQVLLTRLLYPVRGVSTLKEDAHGQKAHQGRRFEPGEVEWSNNLLT